jgi:FixJ family two-component response regulator
MASPEFERPTVYVVDDDPTIQRVVAGWLERRGFTAQPYLSAEEFLAAYAPRETECLLVDLVLPAMSGLELLEKLTAQGVLAPLVIISAVDDMPTVIRAMRGGAIEFVQKPLDEERLVRAVSEALAVDRAAKHSRGDLAARVAELTPRDRRVLHALAAAKTTPEIAAALSIRPATVEKHRQRIFAHLGVDSVPALVRLMRSLGQ